MACSQGAKSMASDINALKDKINTAATRYGIANLGTIGVVDSKILSADITTLKNKLTEINNNSMANPKTDLSTIASYAVGDKILATLMNTIETKATEVYNNYCTCQCNYCTCQCNYCTCNCNYSCTCNCNYCTCNCNNCSCNCNYSCTCNCNYCTCNCNNCSCNCNNCGCYCAHTGSCAVHTCLLPDQLLYTSNGIKKAKDIQTGDYLLTHNGTYEEVYTKWEMINTREKIGILKGKSFEIKLTDDHPLYVYSTESDGLVKVSPEQLAVKKDLSTFKALLPKVEKNKANFDNDDTFLYKLSIPLRKQFVRLLPYLLLRGKFVDTDYVISFNDNEYDLLKRCAAYIEYGMQAHFTDKEGNIHIFADQYLANIPVSEVIKSVIENGIPNWFYNYSDETIKEFIEEMQIINPDMVFPTPELAFQMRLVMAQIGIEAKIVDNKVELLGKMQSFGNYYLMDIESVEIEDFFDIIYNFVMNEQHTYVGEMIVGDGFMCP